ncbi:hypothetical protein LguiA_032445 [Lonicera macranthoides]
MKRNLGSEEGHGLLKKTLFLSITSLLMAKAVGIFWQNVLWGNRWSKIAQHLPGRTDNEIKNYWRTRVQKQARQFKIDSNSKRFIEELRKFWMPRLLEKMEQNSSSSFSTMSTMESQDSITRGLAEFSRQPNKPMNNIDPHKDKSSSKGRSSESFGIIQNSDQLPTESLDHGGYGNSAYNSLPNDCYYVGNNSFDHMEDFNQPDMSTAGLMWDCQMAEIDWVNDDVEGAFWNMDELWQFRK